MHTAQGARFNSALCDSTSLQGAEAAKALRTMWEREAQQQQAALRSSGSRLSPVRRRGSFHQQENKRDIVNDTLEDVFLSKARRPAAAAAAAAAAAKQQVASSSKQRQQRQR